jgi:hypothetical protein
MIGSGRQRRGWALFLLLIELAASSAHAAILRIADGDCVALSAAAASTPGSEPALIVLAEAGHYGACELHVQGAIVIEGSGATLGLGVIYRGIHVPSTPQIEVSGSLTLRNINLGYPDGSGSEYPSMAPISAITNGGELVLDAASVSGFTYSGLVGTVFYGRSLISNFGDLTIRNATFFRNSGRGHDTTPVFPALIRNAGHVEINHSTFVANDTDSNGLFASSAPGSLTIANSMVMNAGALCTSTVTGAVVSRGGNILSDDTCTFASAGDRVVADAKLGPFGDNGGLVESVKLSDRSPAIGNGLAANCEATDARGVVRNIAARGACDAGAYEYGGGRGLLAQGGMNGFFYDAAADGHYVTVQRLDWGSALVIWNTFDRDGNAAWIYAIGMVDGKHIHAGAAQNVGGRLQAGGAPTGSHGIVWGTIDIDISNCFDATFHYDSPLPNFGSGQFPLDRLAFLGDLDCSD